MFEKGYQRKKEEGIKEGAILSYELRTEEDASIDEEFRKLRGASWEKANANLRNLSKNIDVILAAYQPLLPEYLEDFTRELERVGKLRTWVNHAARDREERESYEDSSIVENPPPLSNFSYWELRAKFSIDDMTHCAERVFERYQLNEDPSFESAWRKFCLAFSVVQNHEEKSDEDGAVDSSNPQQEIIELENWHKKFESTPLLDPLVDPEFDPQEGLEAIQRSSSQARKDSLSRYREQLLAQREGLARAQRLLVARIEENPELTEEELMGEMDRLSEHQYHFSVAQRQEAKNIIGEFLYRRDAIARFRERHRDNHERAFEELFGAFPNGTVEFVFDPTTIYVRCYDPDDYARVYEGGFTPDESSKQRALRSGGVSISTCRVPSLVGAITAENLSVYTHWDSHSRGVFLYERQHALHRFFEGLETSHKPRNTRDSDQDLIRELREIRAVRAERRVKDELLAYFTEGRGRKEVLEILFRSESENGLYDYLGDRGTGWVEELSRVRERDVLEQLVRKAFFDEYRRIVADGAEVIEELYQVYHDRQAVIALLTPEPLSRWPALLRRFQESGRLKRTNIA